MYFISIITKVDILQHPFSCNYQTGFPYFRKYSGFPGNGNNSNKATKLFVVQEYMIDIPVMMKIFYI